MYDYNIYTGEIVVRNWICESEKIWSFSGGFDFLIRMVHTERVWGRLELTYSL